MEKVNQIIQGDVLTVLKTFSDESIDMVVTSPPYWGLRDYGKETKSVWDENGNCEHQFKMRKHEQSDAAIKQGPNSMIRQDHTEPKKWGEGFCPKCGAWFGQLGLEPTFDLYLGHLIEIFNEIKREIGRAHV